MSYLQAALKVTHDLEQAANLPNVISQPKKEPKDVEPFPQDWLERFDETTLERLAIMTVDGGMTDNEALKAIDQQPEAIWSNPFPQGTSQARQATLKAITEAKVGRFADL